jgi:hypothetical protein
MSFPSSPTNGQIAVINNITYAYSSATNSWTRQQLVLSILKKILLFHLIHQTYLKWLEEGNTPEAAE